MRLTRAVLIVFSLLSSQSLAQQSADEPAQGWCSDEQRSWQQPASETERGKIIGLPRPAQQLSDMEEFEREYVTLTPDMGTSKALEQRLRAEGLRLLRRHSLNNIGLVLSVFHLPQGYDLERLEPRLFKLLFRRESLALNSRYQLADATNGRLQAQQSAANQAQQMIGWQRTADCGEGKRIGMIDSSVAANHPVLTGQKIVQHPLLPSGLAPSQNDHGTAVAALLVGRADSSHPGLLPAAELHVASGFTDDREGDSEISTERLVLGLETLLSHQVEVINLSLAGPRNRVLGRSVRRVVERGVPVVAAAGNNGRNAKPAYPAAEQEAIAVTAIDYGGQRYRYANRGEYLEITAPGVDIWSASRDGSKYYSGTSFAAPFVTAGLALLGNQNAANRKHIQSTAKDLGGKGRDSDFGWGLLQVQRHCMSAN